MQAAYKEILIRKFEAFDLEENPAKKKLLRFEVLNILKELKEPDANDSHLWGLTFYQSEDDQAYHLPLALEKFLEAYQLDSNHFLACLYIAHCYHDIGDYKNALHFYELTNKEKVKAFQTWRYVKLIEQIGYCHFQLGQEDLGRARFLEVLDYYKTLPLEETAFPKEMLECLSQSDPIVLELKKLGAV